MIAMYGIKNCDTVKKARKWLDARNIEYLFCDIRIDGMDKRKLQAWMEELGWETLLNRRGTTWRKLPDADREGLDAGKALRLMVENPTLIKRPVLDLGNRRHVGFDVKSYLNLFS